MIEPMKTIATIKQIRDRVNGIDQLYIELTNESGDTLDLIPIDELDLTEYAYKEKG